MRPRNVHAGDRGDSGPGLAGGVRALNKDTRDRWRAYSFLEFYGIIFEALPTGMVLAFAGELFKGSIYSLPLNFIPILMLTEASLMTVLGTHAWLTTFILYFMFRSALERGSLSAIEPSGKFQCKGKAMQSVLQR